MCYRFATAMAAIPIRQALRLSFHPLNYRCSKKILQSDFDELSSTPKRYSVIPIAAIQDFCSKQKNRSMLPSLDRRQVAVQ